MLIKKSNWPDIEAIFLKLYPDQSEHLEHYQNVFHNLQLMKPEDCPTEITMQYVFEEDDDVVEVYGREKTSPDFYALEYQPWAKWLGMTISEETVNGFSELEIVAHCLYEMTFAGFDEKEIQIKWLKMNKK